MQDRFGRTITYMRVSVTDLCNLRCRYCMPEEGIDKKLTHPEMMTEDELVNAVRAAAELGVRKIRLTGGEPLVKKNIISICRRIHEIPGIEEIGITTNGTLLPRYAKELKEAGVGRVNISLDTEELLLNLCKVARKNIHMHDSESVHILFRLKFIKSVKSLNVLTDILFQRNPVHSEIYISSC